MYCERRHADVVSESVDIAGIAILSGFFPSLKYEFWHVKVKNKRAPRRAITDCPTKREPPGLSSGSIFRILGIVYHIVGNYYVTF